MIVIAYLWLWTEILYLSRQIYYFSYSCEYSKLQY